MTAGREPLISVIMPVYNAERFLEQAVCSVLGQNWRNLELLLIDDCSADHSTAIARKYENLDPRVRLIALTENGGVARARNRGIREAGGQYIALLDSDDIWYPEKLRLQMDRIQASGAEIAYCSYDFLDETGRTVKKPFLVPRQTDYRHMLTRSVISCSTALIRADLLKAHPFSPDRYHEDFVLWLELLAQPGIRTAGCPEVLAGYRQVLGSRSNDKRNSARMRWRIYREVLGMGPVRSGWIFLQYALYGLQKYYFS